MAGGIERGAIATINYNRKLGTSRKSRYGRVKEQYVGTGNSNDTPTIHNLTPAELAAGRKRAIAFYTKRNIRIYSQIVILSVGAILLVYFLLARFLF